MQLFLKRRSHERSERCHRDKAGKTLGVGNGLQSRPLPGRRFKTYGAREPGWSYFLPCREKPHNGMPKTLHKVGQESSFYLHAWVSREGEDTVGARDRLNLEVWSSLWRPFSGDAGLSLMAHSQDLAGHLLRDRAQTWGLQPGWDSYSRTSNKATTPEVCGFRGPNLGGTNLPCQTGRSYCGWI